MMLGDLTLDQLRILVTVAETGSFSAAGRKLKRVQSAISQSMQMLEANKGLAIFDRSAKTPALTEAGKALVHKARQVLEQADHFNTLAASISLGVEPELALAVDSMVPNAPIMQSLKQLMEAFPDLPVSLFTEGMGAAERRVTAQLAHLAFLPIIPQSRQDLVSELLTFIKLVPVCAPVHPLARLPGPVERDHLMQHVQLVLTDPVANSNPSFGVVSPKIWRFVDHGKRLDFLVNGFGWASVPSHLVENHLREKRLAQLDIRDQGIVPPLVPIYAVHLRRQILGPAATWFLKDLKLRCADLPVTMPVADT